MIRDECRKEAHSTEIGPCTGYDFLFSHIFFSIERFLHAIDFPSNFGHVSMFLQVESCERRCLSSFQDQSRRRVCLELL